QLFLVVAETGVVAEAAVLGIGEPRRHPAVRDDLAHHGRPRRRVLAVSQRKRAWLARSMAFDAPPLQQPADLLRVGHVARRRFPHPTLSHPRGEGRRATDAAADGTNG